MPMRQKRVAPPPRSQAHNSAERAPTDADLIVAASSGRLDVVVALLEAGVSALAVDETGKTSLHKAAYLNLTQMARELIAREPAIVAACDVAHNTALHVAAWAGNLSMCAALLEAMAAVSATDLAGNTPLHHAALEGHTAIGEILLVHGASANAPGLEGSTPLHFVALSMTDAKLSFARLLLRHEADPQIPNRHGMTASRLALDQGNDELAQLLLVLAQPDKHAQPAPSPAEAPQKALDVFGCLLRSLAAKELNEELSVFHRSHRHKFLRHHGGDYPHELACVHAQYVGLVSRHVELALRSAGTSWEAACEACRRAPADGRCSALRLRLLQHLVALEDFPAFFELMLSTQLPGAEAPVAVVNTDREGMNTDHEGSAEGTRGSEAVPDCMGSEVGDELASTVQPYTADVQSGPRSSCASTMRATAAAADAAWVDSPIASFAPSLASTLPSGGAAVVDSGGVSFLSSYAGSAVVGGTYGYVDGAHTSHTYESDSGVSCASSAMRAPMSPVWIEGTVRLADDTTLHSRWVRGRRIGVGSSGEVYRVSDEGNGLEFAAKLVVPRDQEAAERLAAEMTLMRHLRHPNIVEYIGAATCSEGEQCILLELCEGGSVRQLLDREHRAGLPHATLHSYGVQLLHALHYLHAHMIIHRDLKGDNVLLDAARTTVKLGDFGSSNELLLHETCSQDVHTIRGSPYWMSPEHIQGARCGRKADVWSYACVLLEMLTGGMPWLTGGAMQPAAGQFAVFRLMTLIVEAKHPPPMPAPEEIPDGLHELMLACFERDLARRPTTVELLEYGWVIDT